MGVFGHAAMMSDLEAFLLFITNVISGWTPEQIKAYIQHLKKEMNDPKIHSYCTVRSCI